MEDQAMKSEANHGHQGVGSCPRIAGNVDASEAIDRDRTAGLRRSTDRCAIVARSWSDLRAIMVRSACDHGPLEFRTSTRKKLRKFASIRVN